MQTIVIEVSQSKSRRRALAMRSSWLVRWALDAPSRWLGRRSTFGQNMTGGADGLSYLRHLVRGNRLRRRDAFSDVTLEAPPVLLIHGFLGTRGSMYMLERRLVDDGFVVVSFNIGTFNVRDIRRSAFLIHRKIERILAQTPSQKIDVIGHSMGGLIGLYYVKKLGGHARVRKLIMYWQTRSGASWSALDRGAARACGRPRPGNQLLPRSRFLDELAARAAAAQGSKSRTIAAARDWVVPLPTTRLQGANAMTVPLGHSSLVVSEEVYRRVVNTPLPASLMSHLLDELPAT